MADDLTRDKRVWTVPNLLSMARLAGVPVFLWLVLGPEADGWALGLLMLSGFTDYLDGYLARKLDQTSALGEILDPVADRLYILAVVIGHFLRDILPWWVALALPLRDRVVDDKWIRPFAPVQVTDLLHDALERLQHRGAHMARVVEADGRVLGIATLEDVIEELVGEIRDAAHLDEPV